MSQIRYCVNRAIVNKPTSGYEILNTGFSEKTGTLEDIKSDVLNGSALCAGVIHGRRCKSNFVGSNWILLDIDNSQVVAGEKQYHHQMTINEALENSFIKNNCALIYTTPSHQPDWHRFRLVFLLEEWIDNLTQYESIVECLMRILPHDAACKDGVRVFYGNTNAVFPLKQEVFLDKDFIAAGLFFKESKENGTGKDNGNFWREKYREDKASLIRQIRSALRVIPRRETGKDSENYDRSRNVLFALHWLFAGEGDDETGKQLVAEWSPEDAISGEKWNIEQKWRSCRFDKPDQVKLGYLFKVAKELGWTYVEEIKEVKITWADLVEKSVKEGWSDDQLIHSLSNISVTFTNGVREYRDHLLGDDRYEDTAQLVKSLTTEKFALEDFFNEEVSKEYSLMSEEWGVDVGAIVLQILGGLSCLFPTPYRVLLRRGEFDVSPNLYVVHIAPSGMKKSPLMKNLLLFGLDPIGEALSRQYQQKLEEWKVSDRSKRGECPREAYKINDEMPTIEGIAAGIKEYPDVSVIGVFEESNSFVNQDSYSNVKGMIRNFFKKAFDGGSYRSARKTNPIYLKNVQLSLVLMTQPSVWFPNYNLEKDGDGLLSRFLVTEQIEYSKGPKDKTVGHNIRFWTELIYKQGAKLISQSEGCLQLSNERKNQFEEYYEQIEQLMEQETDDYLKQLLGKAQGQIGKIAINIHLLQEIFRTLSPGGGVVHYQMRREISEQSLKLAWRLWQYSYSQMQRIYYKGQNDHYGMDLTSKILKYLDIEPKTKRELVRSFVGKTTKVQPRDIDRAIKYLLKENIILAVPSGKTTRYMRTEK
ncbi:MAG: DUF3987 domain-containing protein [Leptolyngbyaceae cyanobacterium SL_5_14]|nr:DUF3987 domain-containing protein [Leptolyngbyaceae cyanobacterium SL_5_14]